MRIAGDAAMKHPRLAVLALAAVHVLLFGLVAGTWNLPYGLVPAWGTLAQCEGYLLGLWAALGGKLSPWRAVIVAVVLLAGSGSFILILKIPFSFSILRGPRSGPRASYCLLDLWVCS